MSPYACVYVVVDKETGLFLSARFEDGDDDASTFPHDGCTMTLEQARALAATGRPGRPPEGLAARRLTAYMEDVPDPPLPDPPPGA